MLPPWPVDPPSAGAVLLRAFEPHDVAMALDLATDPYVPLIGTLPTHATEVQARDWMARNSGRWAEGAGFSFAVSRVADGRAVGAIGLWLRDLRHGRARAGYSVAPADRGHGYAADALAALTSFARGVSGPSLRALSPRRRQRGRAGLDGGRTA